MVAALLLAACGRGNDDTSASTSNLGDESATLSPLVTLPVTKAGPSYSEQSGAVIVAGTNQYLAAWSEYSLATGLYRVVAARIGADGTVLDDSRIALPVAPTKNQDSIAVAFDGTNYLVVWATRYGNASNLWGVRIGSNGKLLDPRPFKLGRETGNATNPAVAYTPGGYLVTWSDDRDAGGAADDYRTEVYGARISTAGEVVGSREGFRITNAPGTLDGSLSVAAAGSTFLVGYAKRAGGNGVPHAVRVSDAGAVLDEAPLTFGPGADLGTSPAVASDGSQFFVTWNDSQHINGTRVSKDGARIDESPIAISDDHVAPAVVWDGEAFSVAWKHGTRRVGPTGALLGEELPGGPNAVGEARPALASTGSSLFVIHSVDQDSARGLPGHIEGTLLPKAGGPATKPGVILARGPSLQKDIAMASHGATSLSVWLEYEENASHPKVNAAVFTNGVAKPLAIDPGITVDSAPTAAWDGTTYTVAWQTGEKAEATSQVVHVNEAGQIIDSPVAYAGGSPQLALGGDDKVLLVTDQHGYFVGTPAPKFDRTAPAKLVWDGQSRYVLAWVTRKPDGSGELLAQRFDETGAAMDVPAIKVTALPAEAVDVAMAANGVGDTLIGWNAPTTRQIVGVRLSGAGVADGTLQRLDGASPGGGYHFRPRLAWDGAQWICSYERRADAAREERGGYPLELTRLRSAAAGLTLEGKAQTLTDRGFAPAIAPGAKGTTYFAFEAIGIEQTSGPRLTIGQFTDASAPVVPPPGSSSGGTTAPGDDEDDTGAPATPGADDDNGGKTRSPSGPKPPPTKGATINPVGANGSGGGAGGEDGGCSMTTRSSSSSSSLLVLALALVSGGLARRRARVPHLRR